MAKNGRIASLQGLLETITDSYKKIMQALNGFLQGNVYIELLSYEI